MDVLIRKSDASSVQSWTNGVTGKVHHPDNPLGALTMGAGTARPLDLGDFIIVSATMVNANYNPLTHVRSGPEITVGQDYAATVTYTLTAIPLSEVVTWKKGILSDVLTVKKSPFTWDDGDGAANYRLDGDIKDWMFMGAATFFSNGGAVGWRLDGTQTIWPLPGLFPRDNDDLQLVNMNKTTGAISPLTYAASDPGAGEYTIVSTSAVGVVVRSGAAGTAGDFIIGAVVPPANWPWLTAAVVKKTWTQAQYRAYLWAAFAHLWACTGRYYGLYNAIVGVTGTDAEKIEKLTNPEDPAYVDLTTGWPETSVN